MSLEDYPLEDPKVYCPKDSKDVPIWWCLGSFMQRKEPCPELIEAKVNIPDNYAEVKCSPLLLKPSDIQGGKVK